ncbi:transposase, mutator type [Artemisia annua]|uniref:Transposase, mutator type n=1 Tax=Artemisia annua TaxID=35608 RepID=A0A2U1N0H4_ARTAN|nr:transposase, mutator type [Artemisia annua]
MVSNRRLSKRGKTVKCGACGGQGHNKRACTGRRDNQGRTRREGVPNEVMKKSMVSNRRLSKRGKTVKCGACGGQGHNKRACTGRRDNQGRTRREGVPNEVLERTTQPVGSSTIDVRAGPSQPVGTQASEVAAGPSHQVGTQASQVSQSTVIGGGQRKKRIKRKANIVK